MATRRRSSMMHESAKSEVDVLDVDIEMTGAPNAAAASAPAPFKPPPMLSSSQLSGMQNVN